MGEVEKGEEYHIKAQRMIEETVYLRRLGDV